MTQTETRDIVQQTVAHYVGMDALENWTDLRAANARSINAQMQRVSGHSALLTAQRRLLMSTPKTEQDADIQKGLLAGLVWRFDPAQDILLLSGHHALRHGLGLMATEQRIYGHHRVWNGVEDSTRTACLLGTLALAAHNCVVETRRHQNSPLLAEPGARDTACLAAQETVANAVFALHSGDIAAPKFHALDHYIKSEFFLPDSAATAILQPLLATACAAHTATRRFLKEKLSLGPAG